MEEGDEKGSNYDGNNTADEEGISNGLAVRELNLS